VLDCMMKLPTELTTVILVRHARAGHRSEFPGLDHQRPLDEKGQRQAQRLATELVAFHPVSAAAAPLTRCQQTVRPLADEFVWPVGSEPTLSEVSYAQDPAAARRRVRQLARRELAAGPPVVCSQGGVIPGVLADLALRSELTL